MMKPKGMKPAKPRHARRESREAATVLVVRPDEPPRFLSAEMIDILEEMLEALPGGRLSTFARSSRK